MGARLGEMAPRLALDSILGADGKTSLANLGLLARDGMKNVDEVVLQIMQEKIK